MPLPHPDIFLVAIGLIAGFIDSIAGGGGLIALPAMSLGGVQLAMMNDLPGRIPMNDSARLIIVTLAIAAVTVILDRMARR